MIPVGAIVGLAVAAQSQIPRPSASRRPGWYPLLWVAWFVLQVAALRGPTWMFVLPVILVPLLVAPWPLARAVAIPLGLPRVAYWLAVMSDETWRRDHRGGGALAAVMALLRMREVPTRDVEWVLARLKKDTPVRGAGLVAAALLEAVRGRDTQCDALLSEADAVHPNVMPDTACKLAAEWRMALAVEQGDWAKAADIGRSQRPRSRLTRLLGFVARRFAGEDPAPGPWVMWAAWAWAPRRVWTWGLVKRALATVPPVTPRAATATKPSSPEPVVPTRLGPLVTALGQHAQLARRPADVSLAALVDAWDGALADEATRRFVAERSAALGVTTDAMAELRDEVVAELAALARASGAPLPAGEGAPGSLRERLRWELREHHLQGLELAARELSQRAEEKRALPASDEWRAWLAIRDQAEKAFRQCGPSLQRTVFPVLNDGVTNWAVWLWNDRSEKAVAQQALAWLLVQARAAGDERATELHVKNAACPVD